MPKTVALPTQILELPDWSGCDVVIVASGPSLSTKQIHAIAKTRLSRESLKVVVINDAVYPLVGICDWLHACDRSWWEGNIRYVHEMSGLRTCTERDVPGAWVSGYFEASGEEGFDHRPGYVRTGRNSGYQALHCAIKTNPRRIVLVGFDMSKASDGAAHFHPERDRVRPADYRDMAPLFMTLTPAIVDMGVQVLNATPGSAITAFEQVDLLSALTDS